MNIKTAFLDIETSSLEADNDKGFILCASMKIGGDSEPIFTTKISDSPGYGARLASGKYNLDNDIEVCRAIKKWVEANDPEFIVAHFGERFDFPYINTRLIGHRLSRMRPVRIIDTWKIARYTLKLGRNSLESLADHLSLRERKLHLPLAVWRKAALGSYEDTRKIVARCESDVRVLEAVFDRILPMTRGIRGSLM